MSSPLIIMIVIGFILVEIIWSISRAIRGKKIFDQLGDHARFLSKLLANPDSIQSTNFSSEVRKNPAADYLASCSEYGQQVDANTFSKFLTDGVWKAYQDIQATANTMPIIGLMGTFTGIIIGIFQIDLVSKEVSTALQPLIDSAGLAFMSSLIALICATLLKIVSSNWKKALDAELDKAQRNLLVCYLPQVSSNNTDEMFAKSVRRLEKSVRSFSGTFEKVTKDFISQFKPLVEEQREINQKTSQHIDSVATKLDENAKALLTVSDKQIQQVSLFSTVSDKLTEASDSLQASMKLASENLEKFVKLGDEMQQNIGAMHEPLQKIITSQNESVDTLKNLYLNVDSYNSVVKQYLNNLNAKMDMFRDVGEKVHEVRKDFDDFSKSLDKILKQITDQANDLHKDLRDSFTLYDRNLKTLFTDVLENRRDIHMAYYDPEVIKQLDKACTDNKTILSTMDRHLHFLRETTDRFLETIENLRGWGIYRVKRDGEAKQRKGR